MNEKTARLLELVQNHPTLPIIPMVWEEIVADCASCYWQGSFGEANVGKYWMGEERIYIYDPEDIEEVINDPACKYDPDDLTDEQAQEVYEGLPWVDAIFVYIEMPD